MPTYIPVLHATDYVYIYIYNFILLNIVAKVMLKETNFDAENLSITYNPCAKTKVFQG